MCEYCTIEDYVGEIIPFKVKVDGTRQNYEIYILDDLDYEQYSLTIDGTFSEIRIGIKYCPMCGRSL
jgi:hypothetical protein